MPLNKESKKKKKKKQKKKQFPADHFQTIYGPYDIKTIFRSGPTFWRHSFWVEPSHRREQE